MGAFCVFGPWPFYCTKTYEFGVRDLGLRVFTSRSRLGLCPTWNWPDDIGFPVRKPIVDRKIQRVQSDRSCLISGRIGRIRRWCCRRFHFDDDLYFYQIFAGVVQKSLDLSKTTSNRHLVFAKLMRFDQKYTKSLSNLSKYHRRFARFEKNHWSFTRFEQNPSYF